MNFTSLLKHSTHISTALDLVALHQDLALRKYEISIPELPSLLQIQRGPSMTESSCRVPYDPFFPRCFPVDSPAVPAPFPPISFGYRARLSSSRYTPHLYLVDLLRQIIPYGSLRRMNSYIHRPESPVSMWHPSKIRCRCSFEEYAPPRILSRSSCHRPPCRYPRTCLKLLYCGCLLLESWLLSSPTSLIQVPWISSALFPFECRQRIENHSFPSIDKKVLFPIPWAPVKIGI